MDREAFDRAVALAQEYDAMNPIDLSSPGLAVCKGMARLRGVPLTAASAHYGEGRMFGGRVVGRCAVCGIGIMLDGS